MNREEEGMARSKAAYGKNVFAASPSSPQSEQPKCVCCGEVITSVALLKWRGGYAHPTCLSLAAAPPISSEDSPRSPDSEPSWRDRIAAYAFDFDGYSSLSERDKEICDAVTAWVERETESLRSELSAAQRDLDNFINGLPQERDFNEWLEKSQGAITASDARMAREALRIRYGKVLAQNAELRAALTEAHEAIDQALTAMREPCTLEDARRARRDLTHFYVEVQKQKARAALTEYRSTEEGKNG